MEAPTKSQSQSATQEAWTAALHLGETALCDTCWTQIWADYGTEDEKAVFVMRVISPGIELPRIPWKLPI